MYKTVLMGDLKLTEYRERNKKYKKNYYIRSLKKALGVGNTKSLNSTRFVGFQFIDMAFKNGTHMEYLKEMFQRLNYVLAGHVRGLQTEFNLSNIKTAITLFLMTYTSPAFTAVYLFKSMFKIVGFSNNVFLLDKCGRVSLGEFVDEWCNVLDSFICRRLYKYKNLSLEIRFTDLIYAVLASDDILRRKYLEKLSNLTGRFNRADPNETEKEILFYKIKFIRSELGTVAPPSWGKL